MSIEELIKFIESTGWHEFVDGRPVDCKCYDVSLVTDGVEKKRRYFIIQTQRREDVSKDDFQPLRENDAVDDVRRALGLGIGEEEHGELLKLAIMARSGTPEYLEQMWWDGYIKGLGFALNGTGTGGVNRAEHERIIAGAKGPYPGSRAYASGYRFGCEGQWIYPPVDRSGEM